MLCLILNEETIVIKIWIFQDNRQDEIGIKKNYSSNHDPTPGNTKITEDKLKDN